MFLEALNVLQRAESQNWNSAHACIPRPSKDKTAAEPNEGVPFKKRNGFISSSVISWGIHG
jgi:hypothetical protein